jgi:hypothetical protein
VTARELLDKLDRFGERNYAGKLLEKEFAKMLHLRRPNETLLQRAALALALAMHENESRPDVLDQLLPKELIELVVGIHKDIEKDFRNKEWPLLTTI